MRIFFLAPIALVAAACGSTIPGTGSNDAGTSNVPIGGNVGGNLGGGTSGSTSGSTSGNTSGGGAVNQTYCSGSGTNCSCEFGADISGGNATACNNASFTSAVCCADIGWPAHNLSCDCQQYTCKAENGSTGNGETCTCSLYAGGSNFSCTDTTCCFEADTGTCHCGTGSFACSSSFEQQVASCGIGYAQCTGGSKQLVNTCSVK